MNKAHGNRRRIDGGSQEQLALVFTASCGMALSSGVIASLVYLLLTMASLVAVRPAIGQAAPVSAGVRLQAGIDKEDVDGDLKAAMDIYERIAADNSAPREVRARALLRLAGCEEKLGRQAKQVYLQIVREYGDQAAATQARKQLALIRQKEQPPPPKTMSMRRIDSRPLGEIGPTDTDGERAVYWSAGHEYFGDLAGRRRQLVGDFRKHGAVPSRDLSMVALNLKADSARPHTLAVIKPDGTGYRELLRDDDKSNIFGITSSFNMTWSWDDRYIEICDFHPWSKELGQVWIVSVNNGRHRVLVDQADGFVRKAVFSPNGQFVAYEAWPRNDLAEQTYRIFVVPIRGGTPRLVFESSPWKVGNAVMSLMDWTSDGRYLVVHDVRQGKSALYLLPMKDGAAGGDATFLRFGQFDDGYTTASGALVVQDNAPHPENLSALLSSIDSDGHLGTWRPLDLNASKNAAPSFSPDGSRLAYVGLAPDPTRRSLIVRDIATGHEREIHQSAYGSLTCQYSLHNPRVYCTVEEERGESEFFSVEVESGVVEHIATFPEARYLVKCGWDDQTFYFSPNGWRFNTFDPPIIEWNRSTEKETVIAEDARFFQMPSSDGRSIVGLRDGTLSVRPISGGEWVPLVSGVRVNSPVFPTADGKWVFYQDKDAEGEDSLFRVAAAAGEPQRVGNLPDNYSLIEFFFSPDARQVLVWRVASTDLWLLENFEPSPGK